MPLRGRYGRPSVILCAAALAAVLGLWLLFTLLKMNIDGDEAMIELRESAGSGVTDAAIVDTFTETAALFKNEKTFITGAFAAIFAVQPPDLEISEVLYSRRTITLVCQSPRALCGADFAALLRQSAAFAAVSYAGVSRAGTGYSFEVAVTLPEGEGAFSEAD